MTPALNYPRQSVSHQVTTDRRQGIASVVRRAVGSLSCSVSGLEGRPISGWLHEVDVWKCGLNSRAAGGTVRAVLKSDAHAGRAQSGFSNRSQWILTLAPESVGVLVEVNDPDRRVDCLVLDYFRAGGKLRNGDVAISIKRVRPCPIRGDRV